MKVRFYKSASGRVPARDFMLDLHESDRTKVLTTLAHVELSGLNNSSVIFRNIDGKLWEIKIRGYDGSYRLFYVTLKGPTIVILHGYKKQSQKAPIKELDIAKQRMKEVLNETACYIN